MAYIEAGNVADRYDWSVGDRGTNFVAVNGPVFMTLIPSYLCPADTPGYVPVTGAYKWAHFNYAACFSPDGSWVAPGNYPPDPFVNHPALNPSVKSKKLALFNFNLTRSPKEVEDGTSNTFAYAEIIHGVDGVKDFRGTWSVDHGTAYTHRLGPNSTLPDVGLCPPEPDPIPPCYPAPTFATAYWAARSYHVGGVNGARIDGSVTFVSNDINSEVWIALGSINGGETRTE